MLKSAMVEIFDGAGRRDDGLFKLHTPLGDECCPHLTSANGTNWVGRTGKPYDFGTTDSRNMMRTVNALTNSITRYNIHKAVKNMEACLSNWTGDKLVTCKRCSEQVALRKVGDSFNVPFHGKGSDCPVFETVGKTEIDCLVNLFGKAMVFDLCKNVFKKYNPEQLPAHLAGCEVRVPIGFFDWLGVFWTTIDKNSSRVFPSSMADLTLEIGFVAPLDAQPMFINCEFDVVQFMWDNPKTCVKHVMKLFTVDALLENSITSSEELNRVAHIEFE